MADDGSCLSCASSTGPPHYTYKEEAWLTSTHLRLYPTSTAANSRATKKTQTSKTNDKWHADLDLTVSLQAHASIRTPSSIASPFPLAIQDIMMNTEGLQRVVVQSSSSSVSSTNLEVSNNKKHNDNDSTTSEASELWKTHFPHAHKAQHVGNIGTPSGYSVYAQFLLSSTNPETTNERQALQATEAQWETLLRSLSSTLTGCGAVPFVRRKKNQREGTLVETTTVSLVDSSNNMDTCHHGNTNSTTDSNANSNKRIMVEYRGVAPSSDGGGMSTWSCIDGMLSFTSLLPSKGRKGFFSNLMQTGEANSEDEGNVMFPYIPKTQHNLPSVMWMEISKSFASTGGDDDKSCTSRRLSDLDEEESLHLRQGVTYHTSIPVTPILTKPPSSKHTNSSSAAQISPQNVSLSLAEAMTPFHSVSSKKKQFAVCPMAESTLIHTSSRIPPMSMMDPRVGRMIQWDPSREREAKGQSVSWSVAAYTEQITSVAQGYVSHDVTTLVSQNLQTDMLSQPWVTYTIPLPPTLQTRQNHDPKLMQTSVYSTFQFQLLRLHQRSPYSGVSNNNNNMIQTVVRNGHSHRHACVEQWMEVYPLDVVQPLFSTWEIWLYEGGGAGQANFSPQHELYPQRSSTEVHATRIPNGALFRDSHARISFHAQEEDNETPMVTMQLFDIVLPPDASLWWTVQYQEVARNFEELPADPNRGMDLPPSMVTLSSMSSFSSGNTTENVEGWRSCSVVSSMAYGTSLSCDLTEKATTTLFSSGHLVSMPLPDPTMPFNVITLTMTAYAFVLGTMMNVLVRRGSRAVHRALGRKMADDKQSKKKMKALLQKWKKEM